MSFPDQTFADLGLTPALLEAVSAAGFEVPTPIQARTIPLLLAGSDVLGQAQTGTGKTAAFALPMLQALDLGLPQVQGLVLAPTRELAIQVAEAIHGFGRALGGVSVLPVYGGQPIQVQLKRLSRAVHIVVGTPGRILDHLHRGTLDLSHLRFVVLDEADEMLRMGFIDDVEAILGATPRERQTALFSATLPQEVRRVGDRHLREPTAVDVEPEAVTVPEIDQRYLKIAEQDKLEALVRLLETILSDAVLVFTRTRLGCAEVAEKLQSRGHAVEALHGDMSQWQRERVVEQLRQGRIDVVIATDVAARGLDVERISHVVNLDIPYDVEVYVHRIGRTGRAGRAGKAILFVTPRERRLLRQIERFLGHPIEPMDVPSRAEVFTQRVNAFKEQLLEVLTGADLELYQAIVSDLADETGAEMVEIAAAAARLARGDNPLVAPPPVQDLTLPSHPLEDKERVRLWLAVGSQDGVRPGNIVGALANEGGVPGPSIGAIDIHRDHCFVDIPGAFLAQVLHRMERSVIRRRPVRIRVAERADLPPQRRGRHRR